MTEDSDEKLLTVHEIARYMQMSEQSILKMVRSGELPGAQVGKTYRFKKSVIDEWLDEKMGGVSEDDLSSVPSGQGVPLKDVLSVDSVIMHMEARDGISAIEQLVQRAFSQGWVLDKEWFIGAVVEREALASTAMDGGVAFLHTRRQNARKIKQPFIVVGRSHQGIDFGAPNGEPTYLFFLLGLKYDKLHLPILGRLARILQKEEVVRALRAAPTATRICSTLLDEDRKGMASPESLPRFPKRKSAPARLPEKKAAPGKRRVTRKKKA